MTDHLPECWKNLCETCDSDACPPCICTPLRACEQRVFQEQNQGRQHEMVLAYLRGLDAAEAAVAAIDRFDWIPPTYAKTKVIAAIRALKEKP